MQNRQRVWGFFAHASIIVGTMFLVFFVIDRFNPAMEFLTSSLSKWLLLILAVCAVVNGIFSAMLLFQRQKRQEEKHSAPHAASTQQHIGAPALKSPAPEYARPRDYYPRQSPQPGYDGRRG